MFACFLFQINFSIFVSSYCSLVELTSYCLNPNLVLNLCAAIVLQSMIVLIANLSIKILLSYFFGSSTNLYICFLWSQKYFLVVISKFLWSNPSYICLSFNHNIPLPSSIAYTLFLPYVFVCIYQSCIYSIFHIIFSSFNFFFRLIISS